MTVLLWLLLLPVAFVVALASSAKLRKNAFIWLSYATITGWYYFRVLHKKYTDTNSKEPSSPSTSPPSSSTSSSNKTRSPSYPRAFEGPRDPDVIYFESRDVVERRQQEEQHERLERSGVSERSSHMSDSGSSGGSDAATPTSKHKLGLFHSRRKAAAEEAMRRVSDASSADLLTNSGASETSGSMTPGRNSATRRTYTGRKKPVSWAD
ncbi:hypothetical protein PRIC2_009972 [Phytophthora ramorum]